MTGEIPPALVPYIRVVEDEDSLATPLEYNLTKEGYGVALCADGEEALILIDKRQPDLGVPDWNLAGFYQAHGIEVRIAAEYVSHSLFGLGGADKSTDTLRASRLSADLSANCKLNSRFTVYCNAENLTDEPLRYYEGVPSRPIQREFYDLTYEGGLRASF